MGTDGGPRVYDLGIDDARILAHLDWACDELGIDRGAPGPRRLRELLGQD